MVFGGSEAWIPNPTAPLHLVTTPQITVTLLKNSQGFSHSFFFRLNFFSFLSEDLETKFFFFFSGLYK